MGSGDEVASKKTSQKATRKGDKGDSHLVLVRGSIEAIGTRCTDRIIRGTYRRIVWVGSQHFVDERRSSVGKIDGFIQIAEKRYKLANRSIAVMEKEKAILLRDSLEIQLEKALVLVNVWGTNIVPSSRQSPCKTGTLAKEPLLNSALGRVE
jgi:hypothetical protein